MKHLFLKDKKKRILLIKNYIKKQCLKSIQYNENLSRQIRWQSSFLQYSMINSIARIKNRCILTNRSHSILKRFKLSRMEIRKLTSLGLISGLQKSSW